MLKNRLELAKYFAELGFSKGAEIGVYRAYFSKVLLDTIPNLNLLSIDPWHRQRIHQYLYPEAVKVLSSYKNSTILRGFSTEVAKLVTDESLDFVYIDGDHSYKSVKEDIEAWFSKVRKGGIVSGHDYYVSRAKNKGVIEAVDEFVQQNGYNLELTSWDKVTIIEHDDRQPSWYFVK